MARPTVTVYAEVSADGKTTHAPGASSKPMMSFEDDAIRRFRHELRARSDAIMVGSNTVRLDNPSLTVRHAPGPTPLRVVPATLADIPLDSTLLNDGHPTLIATSERAPAERISALQEKGATVFSAGRDNICLTLLLARLYERGIRSLVVEGGATLLAALFRDRLVDHLIIQHLPVVFGGSGVPAMVGGPSLKSLGDAIPLRLVCTRTIGHHAVIEYDVST